MLNFIKHLIRHGVWLKTCPECGGAGRTCSEHAARYGDPAETCNRCRGHGVVPRGRHLDVTACGTLMLAASVCAAANLVGIVTTLNGAVHASAGAVVIASVSGLLTLVLAQSCHRLVTVLNTTKPYVG